MDVGSILSQRTYLEMNYQLNTNASKTNTVSNDNANVKGKDNTSGGKSEKKSFAKWVYNQEEMEKYVDDLIKSNEYKTKTLRESMLEMNPGFKNTTFTFWDEPNKHYTFEEMIKEDERRYGQNWAK